MKKGFYVVEYMFDYCMQKIAFETEEEAKKYIKEKCSEDEKYWVTFYRFGEEFEK